MSHAGSRNAVIAVRKWHSNLAASVGCEYRAVLDDLAVPRIRDIRPDIGQPSLRGNLLAIRPGGVTLLRRGNRKVCDVEQGSITMMPALEPS